MLTDNERPENALDDGEVVFIPLCEMCRMKSRGWDDDDNKRNIVSVYSIAVDMV